MLNAQIQRVLMTLVLPFFFLGSMAIFGILFAAFLGFLPLLSLRGRRDGVLAYGRHSLRVNSRQGRNNGLLLGDRGRQGWRVDGGNTHSPS